MAGPFFNGIKGTTAGTPGTGAFTPNAASAGFLAWSAVSTGWIGLVRYEDGAAWELQYSYWNGTTLSRAATTQFVSSSSGSALTLTSAATAAMVLDANEIAPHLGVPWRGWMPNIETATFTTLGITTPTLTGTAAAPPLTATNRLTEQPRVQITSATTANAQAGTTSTFGVAVVSTTAGQGGGEMTFRFGCAALPTGPRVFAGLTGTTFVANTGEPSALVAHYAVLGKDSTDTNMQFLVNSNAGAGTKTDTGIPLVANSFYECAIWFNPGGNTMFMLLIRFDTGAIYYGSTATDVPATSTVLRPQILTGLSATTGTAIVLHAGAMFVRTGNG